VKDFIALDRHDQIALGVIALIGVPIGYLWGLGFQLLFTRQPALAMAMLFAGAFAIGPPYLIILGRRTGPHSSKWLRFTVMQVASFSFILPCIAAINYLIDRSAALDWRDVTRVAVLICVYVSLMTATSLWRRDKGPDPLR
jgi:hypothetical protein